MWRGAVDPARVDLARRRACKAVDKFVLAEDGRVIKHPDILYCHKSLYRQDGVHMSEWGMDLWLHGIRHALWEWVQA